MLLSIITVNLNNAEGFLNTAKSIVNQTTNHFEWLVIDGGSTDDSVKLIQSFEQYTSYWISEPDKGIYQAMNKGIAQAKGDYLLFLNSGDVLYNEHVLAELIPILQKEGVYYSNAANQGSHTAKINTIKYPKQLSSDFFIKRSLNHQNCIISRSLFLKYGFYDEGYQICADWDFTVQLFIKGETFSYIEDLIISCFNTDGVSSDYKTVARERKDIIQQKYPAYQLQHQQLLIKKNSLLFRLKNKIKRTLLSRFSMP
ncbi:glycosyltransferase family 2 protein [Pedobacter montanisoli]|uniref:Glycosyltransferase n=1 Tax=Pedobacter montanisoli TaxID=2923277 RepID=A0ABS9ZVX1_9SPHI|nr:glycosyltransferase family 2 protein [Pedobacter montanisoli]MCJ0742451.1 glycosyltransferase [Pedobacter montanisoli]